MKYLSALAAMAVMALGIGLAGCGGDEPITQDPALIGTWSAQDLGFSATITFNTNGTTEAVIGSNLIHEAPEHQTGTWYTQGSDLVLTSESGKVTRVGYIMEGDTFKRLNDSVIWKKI
ncbi:MAG: hypothetical protein WCN95_03270 [bacterium]